MRKRLLLFLMTVTFLASVFAGELSPGLNRIREDYRLSGQDDLTTTDIMQVREVDGVKRISVILSADDASLLRARNIPHSKIAGDYYSAQVTPEDLEAMASDHAIRKVENVVKQRPHNDLSIPKINADDVHAAGYTGDDVLIGIVDSGIDLDHPAFQDASGNTRILYLWDQTVGSNNIYVGTTFIANYGTDWTSTQIDAGSCTEADTSGHGTHVSGSMGGYDTNYTARQGGATTANIIFVKTDFYNTVKAVEYIYERARELGKPVIVNMSLGSQYGPHDGTDTDTAALDALIENSNGDLVVVRSAGNDGDSACHGYLDSVTTASTTLDFDISAYTATSGASNDYLLVNFYYDSANTLDLRITDSAGNVSAWITANSYSGTMSDGTGVSVTKNIHDADTKNIEIMLGDHAYYGKTENEYPRPGTGWKFEFRSQSGTVARLDGWIYNAIEDPNTSDQMYFNVADTEGMSLGNGACGNNVIAVAAYTIRRVWTAKDGSWTYNYTADDVTPFSSRGPTRDGRNKPDVTGPGSIILSARSADEYYVTPDSYLPADDSVSANITYRYMQGTSMSSPIVAGGVALIKGLNPAWEYSDIIDYFKTNSQGTSQYTWSSNSWDREWGWGVLDLTNASAVTPFALTAPADGSIYAASTGTFRLEWESAGTSGITYYIEMDVNPDFSTYSTLGSTSDTYQDITVPAAGKYYLRVKADSGITTAYSSNSLSIISTNLDEPGAFEYIASDDGAAEESFMLLSQALDASKTVKFAWADTNNLFNVTYEAEVYAYGGTPAGGSAYTVTDSSGTYSMNLTPAETGITGAGRYVFRLRLYDNSDPADEIFKEQEFYVRDLDAELLPNLLNDDYVKVGVVGSGFADSEKTSDTFVLMNYTVTAGTSGYFGMEANGTGLFSSTYTFNDTAYGTPLSVNIALAGTPLNLDTGITLTRSAASPSSEPNALGASVALLGDDEFTYIRVRNQYMHGIDASEGPIFYIAHIDEGIAYESETHKLAVWHNGAWKDTDRISRSGYYTVLPGRIPVMNFKSGDLSNAPNPFNPSTTVNYSVGESGRVKLSVYDSRGRLVKVLVDRRIDQPGDYDEYWDGRDLRGHEVSSGVYYAVMELNGKRYARKMVMLK